MNKETEIKYLNQDEIRDFIMQKDYKIYKLQQRIDKAIEYIEDRQVGMNIYGIKPLLKILRGEDNE